MLIIPIYKSAKKKDPSDPAAFRPVALAETILKLTETVFINAIRKNIESNLGDFQNAYKTGHGTNTALKSLFEATSAMKKD